LVSDVLALLVAGVEVGGEVEGMCEHSLGFFVLLTQVLELTPEVLLNLVNCYLDVPCNVLLVLRDIAYVVRCVLAVSLEFKVGAEQLSFVDQVVLIHECFNFHHHWLHDLRVNNWQIHHEIGDSVHVVGGVELITEY